MFALITGTSSGIGYGISKALCEKGYEVIGLSRKNCELSKSFTNYHHLNVDLTDYANLESNLKAIFNRSKDFDLIILNAGILGHITPFPLQSVAESKLVMDINVWSNKAIIDLFLKRKIRVKQWVAISSGAAKNGSAGWGSYSASKAALNMLIQTYASENKDTHFSALAPGLVDTKMQDYISSLPSDEGMPSIAILKSAKGTPNMPTSEAAGPMLLQAMRKAMDYESGVFLDVREMEF